MDISKKRLVGMTVWYLLVCAIVINAFVHWPHSMRRVVGVICLVTFPGAIVFWFVLHPFVHLWRRMGLMAAYLTAFGSLVATGITMFWWRDFLLGKDLGNSWTLVILGLLVYALFACLEVLCRQRLKTRTLVGIPELRNESGEGQLIDDGIYRLVRHPRYLAIIVGMIGLSMIVNHVGIYLLMLAMIPGLGMIAAMEERELLQRFGDAYRRYADQVPRLLPTLDSWRSFRHSFRQAAS